MAWWKIVIRDLLTPGLQAGDWYGWATNQIGHAALGSVLFWAILLWPASMDMAIVAPLALFGVKEAFDLWRGGGELGDGLTDLAFVALGVLAAWAAMMADRDWFTVALAGLVILLYVGVRKRALAAIGAGAA